MTRVPRWTDETAVANLVDAEIKEGKLEIDRLNWIYRGPIPILPEHLNAIADLVHADLSRRWPAENEERVVDAARHGDIEPLARLLAPYIMPNLGIPPEVNPAIKHLSPKTWALIVEFLTGKRNPNTGKRKGERGRPKLTADMRRAINPVHLAAEEVPAIEAILRRCYPAQTNTAIRKRAIGIAAQRKGARLETLRKHLRRPKTDRRRVGP